MSEIDLVCLERIWYVRNGPGMFETSLVCLKWTDIFVPDLVCLESDLVC